MSEQSSTEAYQAYLKKNANWNFWVNALDLTFYNLAMSFIYGATVLSLYASYLTDAAILIGLIPTVQNVMFLLPQLVMARHTLGLNRKKPLIVRISITERLPYLVVGLAILLWPGAPRWMSYIVLALSLIVATGSGGLAGPAWKTMLAKVVPVERRGMLFGLSNAMGGLLGLGGAAVSRHVLATYAYPTSFGICFLLCFACQLLSYACLCLNREPARRPETKVVSARAYWRTLPAVLRTNLNFSRYLVGRALLTLGTMGTVLYIVYARETFEISDAFAGSLTMAALIGQTIATPLMGRLADVKGNRWLIELGGLLAIGAILLIIWAPDVIWLYLVFVLVNGATATSSIGGMGITMEFCSEDELPTFTALASTISGIPVLLAPIIGGWLTDVGGYSLLFGIALAFSVLGWGTMRWAVRDPRHKLAPSPAMDISGGLAEG